jgi:tripartite-type tricarboxylate transporter receptor subunit TctC
MRKYKGFLMGFRIARLGVALSVVAAVSACGPKTEVQATYPERAVRIMVPFPAGSAADGVARIVLPAAEKHFGQPLIIENQGGSGAIPGTAAAAREKPDGYSLLWTAILTMSTNPHLYKTLPYKPEDFDPIIRVSAQSLIMAVPSATKTDSVASFVEKARTAKYSYGSPGVGTSAHLCAEMLMLNTGIKMRHIPYQAGAMSVLDLMRGEIATLFYSWSQLQPGVQSGELKMLAVAGNQRSRLAPELPTFKELGYDVEATAWYGMFAPRGTPADRIEKVAAAVSKALADPAVIQALERTGTEVWSTSSPAEFASFLTEERARYGKLIETIGIVKH